MTRESRSEGAFWRRPIASAILRAGGTDRAGWTKQINNGNNADTMRIQWSSGADADPGENSSHRRLLLLRFCRNREPERGIFFSGFGLLSAASALGEAPHPT
ncbi:MAG TPA: hypothetical protein VIY51_22570, partial [Xanthobacteraceae bacterium]